MSGWTLHGDPGRRTGGVTAVDGTSFAVSDDSGDMAPDAAHGLFFRDTRILSGWRLLVNGHRMEPLSVLSRAPYSTTFLGVVRVSGAPDATLFVERRRFVGAGMREDVTVRNYAAHPTQVTLTAQAEADFADLFQVKEGRVTPRGRIDACPAGDAVIFCLEHPAGSRGTKVGAQGASASGTGLQVTVDVPAHGACMVTFTVVASVDGSDVPPKFPADQPVEDTQPARDMQAWRRDTPTVSTSWRPLATALQASERDLGALRITDPEHPQLTVVAAGAPWFMTVFGRDSLLASWMTLPFNQDLALGTLQTLARYQGRTVDPQTEEEPGRILHEMRFGVDAALALGGSNVYYGTADATPLFVMLLGELRRWGLARLQVDALLPAADAALAWIEQYGDRDGDGFVEYQRSSDAGLVNQGWKDSYDGINFADGRLAEPPIALAEVQGYVYAAYIARAHFAHEAGDEAGFHHWAGKAGALKEKFNREFWLPDRGYYAVALDRDKQPVDALASNMGHCLWAGIVDEDRADAVADQLLDAQMFTGFGVRTLATTMARYNPVSYHNGSVWPHDNALIAAGLMRYGQVEHAQRIAVGLLEAAEHLDGRLPELFCGFDRATYPVPVPYPTSCSPQAWAAATPVQLLRTLLRLDPWVPHGKVWLRAALPEPCRDLLVEHLPLDDARLTIRFVDGSTTVTGLPRDIKLVRAPRRPLTAATAADHEH